MTFDCGPRQVRPAVAALAARPFLRCGLQVYSPLLLPRDTRCEGPAVNEPPFALRSMQVLTTALDSPLRLALLGSHAAGCEGAGCPRVYEQFWHAGLSESEHFASSRAVDDLGAVLAQAQARKDAALVTKPCRPRGLWHAIAQNGARPSSFPTGDETSPATWPLACQCSPRRSTLLFPHRWRAGAATTLTTCLTLSL